MSAAKNTPKTPTTASNDSSGRPVAVASPVRNATFSKPALAAFCRACARSGSARSTPVTLPVGPTACAAGSADPPAPQQASSTVSPGESGRRATVTAPHLSQKPSAGAEVVVGGSAVRPLGTRSVLGLEPAGHGAILRA
jgi:hypothetical protein